MCLNVNVINLCSLIKCNFGLFILKACCNFVMIDCFDFQMVLFDSVLKNTKKDTPLALVNKS